MNLLLLRAGEITDSNSATISGYRAEHIIKVLKMQPGAQLSVGAINGKIGRATVQEIHNKQVTLSNILLQKEPPKLLDVEVLLALPRPRMLQRSLQTMATMGVKKIHLIHSERVEKSFWQTPLLSTENIEEQLLLGLEQAKATQLPELTQYKRWKDVRTDLLPTLTDLQKVIAHPGDYPAAKVLPLKPTALAIGPEGGFTEKEVAVFLEKGFQPAQLGQRILRVETAVPVLLAKLFDF